MCFKKLSIILLAPMIWMDECVCVCVKKAVICLVQSATQIPSSMKVLYVICYCHSLGSEEAIAMGHSWGTLRTLAQDRLRWREFVAALVVSDKKGSK